MASSCFCGALKSPSPVCFSTMPCSVGLRLVEEAVPRVDALDLPEGHAQRAVGVWRHQAAGLAQQRLHVARPQAGVGAGAVLRPLADGLGERLERGRERDEASRPSAAAPPCSCRAGQPEVAVGHLGARVELVEPGVDGLRRLGRAPCRRAGRRPCRAARFAGRPAAPPPAQGPARTARGPRSGRSCAAGGPGSRGCGSSRAPGSRPRGRCRSSGAGSTGGRASARRPGTTRRTTAVEHGVALAGLLALGLQRPQRRQHVAVLLLPRRVSRRSRPPAPSPAAPSWRGAALHQPLEHALAVGQAVVEALHAARDLDRQVLVASPSACR